MITITKLGAVAFAAALSGVLLAGCSTTDTGAGPTARLPVPASVLSASSKIVRDALSDGKVSRDEYDAAYRDFAACMDAGGSPLQEQPMQEDTYQYGVPDSAQPVYKKCYNKDFYAVDIVWQLAHPTIATRLSTCLVKAGDDFGGTVEEMKAELVKDGKDPDKCLADG